MSVFFFGTCALCVLYCALYGAYSIADRKISQAVSAFVMATLAAGTAVVLAVVA